MKKKDYKKLLNLNFVDITNKTYSCGQFDMPYVYCNEVDIDYVALYPNLKEYNKTTKTAVAFYVYDSKFDGKNGLFQAIYYNDKKRKERFEQRFKNVKYAIAPDYSLCGDIPVIENIYRIFKSRIVSLWLTDVCDIIVIPNITYANENYFDIMLDGLEECECVAFSVKGSVDNIIQKELLIKAIRHTVDNLHKLKTIIAYSVSVDDCKILNLFSYAVDKEIKIVIPDNLLKNRNLILEGSKNG